MIECSGSVRVDLLGGTLDLNPINLILPNVVTLNVATSLKAQIQIEKVDKDGITLISQDYKSESHFNSKDFTSENLRGGFFDKLTFMALILDHFKLHSGLVIKMKSGSPPGAGLGGSSAMGVTFYAGLCKQLGKELDRARAIAIVNSIEAQILDAGPAGYQDYYPALYGGVLAIFPKNGNLEVEQLYDRELKKVLEGRITLVYSGQTRLSGINNWEVYKSFFDGNQATRQGLADIGQLAHEALTLLRKKDFEGLPDLIAKEGAVREKLFPGIVCDSMKTLYGKLKKKAAHIGMKVCGAGGGGCFLITHRAQDAALIEEEIRASGMEKLPFQVEAPLN